MLVYVENRLKLVYFQIVKSMPGGQPGGLLESEKLHGKDSGNHYLGGFRALWGFTNSQ